MKGCSYSVGEDNEQSFLSLGLHTCTRTHAHPHTHTPLRAFCELVTNALWGKHRASYSPSCLPHWHGSSLLHTLLTGHFLPSVIRGWGQLKGLWTLVGGVGVPGERKRESHRGTAPQAHPRQTTALSIRRAAGSPLCPPSSQERVWPWLGKSLLGVRNGY